MHFVKVTQPKYDASRRYEGQIGEVVGRWGPENSSAHREGFLVEFRNGEIVGIAEDEVESTDGPGS
jgi:hypothetical protein